MATAVRRTFTAADLINVAPSDVRAGDLIAQRAADPDVFVGWRVTGSSPHSGTHPASRPGQWIEFDAGTWQGHFEQPESTPVWIVRRDPTNEA